MSSAEILESQPVPPAVLPSTEAPTASTPTSTGPPVSTLILDAGPLLSHQPLRPLARTFITPPLVLAELRDSTARERWERLKIEGCDVIVRDPEPQWLSEVVAFSKKTGDYAVLSKADLCVLALTWGLHQQHEQMLENQRGAQESQSAVTGETVDEIKARSSEQGTSSVSKTVNSAPPSVSPWTRNQPAASSSDDKDPNSARIDDEAAKEVDGEQSAKEADFPALQSSHQVIADQNESDSEGEEEDDIDAERPGLAEQMERLAIKQQKTALTPAPQESHAEVQIEEYAPGEEDEEEDEAPPSDDGEGDWITPSNVDRHKSKDLGLLPADDQSLAGTSGAGGADDGFTTVSKPKGRDRRRRRNPDGEDAGGIKSIKKMEVACMTGDFAVQNVLLQMGLNLVGQQGKKITQVKSWILRCHACFKLCKDNSKKFCPSCGNPSLIRASMTTKLKSGTDASSAADNTEIQVHLKKNFQYRTRGTKFTIPDPKMGSAKGQKHGGSGLVLREDQREFQDGLRHAEIRRQKEDRALERALKAQQEGKAGYSGGVGGWNDPDWMPEILVTGMSGKGRHSLNPDGFPTIGHGRRNPNQVRKGKK